MQGICAVARINFDDDVEKQEQFWKLIEIVKGDRDRALGRLIRFFRVAQKAYGHDKPMSDDFLRSLGLSDMIESGWAVPVPGGYQAYGAEKHFKWYRKKVVNGKKGGRPVEDLDTWDDEEEKPIGGAIGGAIANPLALAPAPVLFQNLKFPDPVFARETRDIVQDQGPGAGPETGIGLRLGETESGPGSGIQGPKPPEDQEYPFSPAHPDEIAEVEWEMEQRDRNMREWAEEFGELDAEPEPPAPAPSAESAPRDEPVSAPPAAPVPPAPAPQAPAALASNVLLFRRPGGAELPPEPTPPTPARRPLPAAPETHTTGTSSALSRSAIPTAPPPLQRRVVAPIAPRAAAAPVANRPEYVQPLHDPRKYDFAPWDPPGASVCEQFRAMGFGLMARNQPITHAQEAFA